jgi:uncharacterized tellurite resistance protein B-like protein
MLEQVTKKEDSPSVSTSEISSRSSAFKEGSNIEENSEINLSIKSCMISLLVHTAAIDGDVDDREVRGIVNIIDDLEATEADIELAKIILPINAIEWIAKEYKDRLKEKRFFLQQIVKIARADNTIESSEHLILEACLNSWGINPSKKRRE